MHPATRLRAAFLLLCLTAMAATFVVPDMARAHPGQHRVQRHRRVHHRKRIKRRDRNPLQDVSTASSTEPTSAPEATSVTTIGPAAKVAAGAPTITPPAHLPAEVPTSVEEIPPPLEEVPTSAEEEPVLTHTEETAERFFAPTSAWNTEVPADAPLDPDSGPLISALVEELNRESAARTGPWLNTTNYSLPVYTVPAGQPTVPVRLESPYAAAPLRSAFAAVPLPPGAQPAAGTDHSLVVWQPSSDRLWEFWRLTGSEGSWSASWGGAIAHVSESSGVFGPESWPGATSHWGASASGLSLVGGLITLSDLESGTIDHALQISLPQIRSGVYALPAQRTDGVSGLTTALPEGAHLRLNPNLDLASLHLPPLTLMLAEAAQRYGIIVRDHAANITFNAQVPTPGLPNPYSGPHGFLEGRSPLELMAAFPWNELQVLQMSLGAGG